MDAASLFCHVPMLERVRDIQDFAFELSIRTLCANKMVSNCRPILSFRLA